MSKRIGRYVWAEPKGWTCGHGDIYVITEHQGGDLYGIRFHTGTYESSLYSELVTARITGKIVSDAWPFDGDTLLGIIQ